MNNSAGESRQCSELGVSMETLTPQVPRLISSRAHINQSREQTKHQALCLQPYGLPMGYVLSLNTTVVW